MCNGTFALRSLWVVLYVEPIRDHRGIKRVPNESTTRFAHLGYGIIDQFLVWREWRLSHPVQIEKAVKCHVHVENDFPHSASLRLCPLLNTCKSISKCFSNETFL